jgi:hypothetical protein
MAIGGGTTIWKIGVDGTFMLARTGLTDVFVGPSREIDESTAGSVALADIGATYRLLRIAGFQTEVRGGYGTSRVRIGTLIPIEDDRRYWTYGIAMFRPVASRYILRLDARNIHFKRDEVPQTLGQFNVVVLAGFGMRF